MTPKQLRDLGQKMWGKTGWVEKCADYLGKHPATVRRYLAGTVPVPKTVEMVLENLEEEKV